MNPKTLPGRGGLPSAAVIYLRVSTPKQTHTAADVTDDGNSIDTQRKDALNKVRQLGATVVDPDQDVYIEPGNSAQSISKRKVFRQMLQRVMEQRDVEYVVVYSRSRAFRNALEAMLLKQQLKQIGVKLVSVVEDFGEGIYADAMEAISDVFNELEVKRNGEDIKRKMANKVKNGGTPSTAKLGYLNVTVEEDFKRINTIKVDEVRKPLVLAAFELMASAQYTLETLHEKVTTMGLKSRPTKRFPNGHAITLETLRRMLRDRYYIGWVEFKGVEYKGRHETFIDEELFERVQRVLDSHSGAGVREREHPHYLKGWLWCHRCGNRFIVQRAVGQRGGVYFYFFCKGRQLNICDHPYVPVEKMEELVERYYQAKIYLPDDIRAEIRHMVDEAAQASSTLTTDMRDQLAKRLEALDKKETYFLDLAAEEGWPKEKLRQKLNEVRTERQSIQRELDEAESVFETSKSIIDQALKLLDRPADFYREAMTPAETNGKLIKDGELVRSILNKAFFHKFLIDGNKIAKAQLKEPFDVIFGEPEDSEARIYLRQLTSLPTTGRKRGRGLSPTYQLAQCPSTAGAEIEDSDIPALIDLVLAERSQDQLGFPWPVGSSKKVVVPETGFEPVCPFGQSLLRRSCMPVPTLRQASPCGGVSTTQASFRHCTRLGSRVGNGIPGVCGGWFG